jgi:hypothetical protein
MRADVGAFLFCFGGTVGTINGRVRGRTKDECWRNYLDNKRTRGSILLDVIPSNEQDAYKAMKKDHQIGIWTLEFFSRM